MSRISTGTVSVEPGGTTVTAWAGEDGVILSNITAPAGSQIVIEGVANFVKERLSTTSVELTLPHAGDGGNGLPCAISAMTASETSIGTLNARTANIIQQLSTLDANGRGLFYNLIGVTGNNDPGPGKLAFNNADPELITEIYLDVLDANEGGRDVSGIIDLWNAGAVIIVRSLDTNAYAAFRLTGAPGSTAGYRNVQVAHVEHDGTLADEPVAIEWRLAGADKNFDAQVALLAGRAAYDAQTQGFRVLVSNVGDGRAAIYSKLTAASGNWSAPAYVTGVAGVSWGLSYTYSSTATDGDPGSGFFRGNNASPSLITKMWLDNIDADGATVSAPISQWDDLGTAALRGRLVIRSKLNKAVIWAFNVTGSVVDKTGYRELTVTAVTVTGTFADGEDCDVQFTPVGQQGAASTVPGVVWRGTYDGGVLYAINNGVTFNGSSFRKLTTAGAGTSPSGASPPVDTADWEVLAAKGQDGAGTGDVVGPGVATADAVALFNGTTGKALKNSGRLIQTSATDDTAGSLLRVGAFGWGAQFTSPETDLDNYLVSGSYITTIAPTNAPPGSSNARMVVIVGGGSSYITQTCIDPVTGLVATRGYTASAGTWGRWRFGSAGSVVNSWHAVYATPLQTAALIPADNTRPTASEGVQVLSIATGPLRSASNKLRASFTGMVGATAVGFVNASLHINGADAARSAFNIVPTATYTVACPFDYEFLPGSAASVTLAVRIGSQAGLVSANGYNGNPFFGGASGLTLTVEELEAA